jgi:hypothetical protein
MGRRTRRKGRRGGCCGGCRNAAGNRARRCARRPTLFVGTKCVSGWVWTVQEAVMKSAPITKATNVPWPAAAQARQTGVHRIITRDYQQIHTLTVGKQFGCVCHDHLAACKIKHRDTRGAFWYIFLEPAMWKVCSGHMDVSDRRIEITCARAQASKLWYSSFPFQSSKHSIS